MSTVDISSEYNGRGVKLSTHLQLLLGLYIHYPISHPSQLSNKLRAETTPLSFLLLLLIIIIFIIIIIIIINTLFALSNWLLQLLI
jgi:hypothetical protein